MSIFTQIDDGELHLWSYLHIGGSQLAVPHQHDGDDVQSGFIQAFPQHLQQLICDLWT